MNFSIGTHKATESVQTVDNLKGEKNTDFSMLKIVS